MIQKIAHFLSETLWRMELSTRSRWLRMLIHPLRFAVLTARACLRDGAKLHASALTYITMLAIVPVLTLALTSLKAFGAGEIAEAKLLEKIDHFVGYVDDTNEQEPAPIRKITPEMPQQTAAEASLPETSTVATTDPATLTEAAPTTPEDGVEDSTDAHRAASALRKLCEDVFEQIDSINFARIGIVGAILLIIMVVNVLGQVEHSFNLIWGVKKDRSLWRKFSDYLSIIIILPMLILATSSVPILEVIASKMPNFLGLNTLVNHLGVLHWLFPLLMGTTLFAFIFGFLPNTRVRLSSCFLGGFLTTLALGIFFQLCMILQVGIANYSSLYGSFVAFPLLLFWIYASWQILLIGAEVCYVFQYRHELLRESAFSHPSERDDIVIALSLVCSAAQRIGENEGATSGKLAVGEFADALSIPTREVLRIGEILEHNRILLPITEQGSPVPTAYVLNRDINRLRVSDIINACLDDTAGEEVLSRTQNLASLAVVQELSKRFSRILTHEFSMTVSQVIRGLPLPALKAPTQE